jgi:lysophospholipase L1-like esterase
VKAVLQTLALVIASIGVALGVGELALRVVGWRSPQNGTPVDPDLALLNAPFHMNAEGFRGPEVSREPAPGVFRIAIAGDSYTAGMGVSAEDAYPAQLEALLRQAGGDSRFEVLNLGMSGLDIEQVLRRASQVGGPLQPHLVVYGLTLNDILDPGDLERRMQGAHRQALRDQVLRYAASPLHLVRALGPRWMALRQALWPAADDYAYQLARAYQDPAKLARIERGLDGFAALAARDGVCVHVLIHTELAHLRFAHPFRETYETIAAAARARGLSVTSSFPSFRSRDSSALRLSVIDGHPNAAGHRILAEALYAGLRELPPSCRFPALP